MGTLPFLRITSSVSGLRVTVTTFISSLLPPCRIRDTTCLCPSLITFTPFTWQGGSKHRDRVRHLQASACVDGHDLFLHKCSFAQSAAKGRVPLTSMRKSPVLRPALQATPSTSTDSRYWRAGNAGVGVNSSMGVSAEGGHPQGFNKSHTFLRNYLSIYLSYAETQFTSN